MKPILLLDQDLCIADTYVALVEELNHRYSLGLNRRKCNEYFGDYTINHSEIKRWMINEIFSSDNFFLYLPVLPGARTAVKRLKKSFNIFVLTKPYMQTERPYLDKYEWLNKHFPFLASKMIPTEHKYLVYGDILIDDHMLNCKTWKSFWQKKKKKVKTASLKYPWTDNKIVDIVGNNWTDLVDQIEEQVL
jgi:5'(3')-deoxyribonucleotidase